MLQRSTTHRLPNVPARAARLVLGAAALALGWAGAQEAAPGATTSVACDQGASLAEAVAEAEAGATLQVAGTCAESVVVRVDDLTLDGGGSAVVDAEGTEAPALHVDGAQGVTVRGMTVENGQHGLLVENLATLTLEDVTSRDNASHGVEVIHSDVDATGLTSHDNGRVGLIVNRNSQLRVDGARLEDNGISGLVVYSSALVRLEERNVVRGNAGQGVTVGLGGMLFSIGSELRVEDSGAEGIHFLQGGAAQFLGGSLTVTGNAGDGIGLDVGSSVLFGRNDFPVDGEATVEGNEGHGLSVAGGAQLVVEPIMPLTVTDNAGAGLRVDGGAQATVRSSTLEGNEEAALRATFGALVTVEGGTVGEVACDDTARVRGDASCPQ